METRTYTVYDFDELSPEAKEKAIQDYRENGFDYDWYDFVYDDVDQVARLMGISIDRKSVPLMGGSTRQSPVIYFSGFASQGDGACFEGVYHYAKESVMAIMEYAPQDKTLHQIAEDLAAIQKHNRYQVSAMVKHTGHYYYSGSTTIEVFDGNGDDLEMNQANDIRQLLRDFMDWIYARLQEEYDYQTSDEAITETIKANEWKFTADGRID